MGIFLSEAVSAPPPKQNRASPAKLFLPVVSDLKTQGENLRFPRPIARLKIDAQFEPKIWYNLRKIHGDKI
jgi:hypothetical protein